jgi:uncharacterized protein
VVLKFDYRKKASSQNIKGVFMTANFGVIVKRESKVARPISIDSSTIIGIVGTNSGSTQGLYYLKNIKDALSKFNDLTGTLCKALKDIENFNLNSSIIISVSKSGEEVDLIEAIVKLKESSGELYKKPDMLILPEFSYKEALAKKLLTIAEALKSYAVIDCNTENEKSALEYVKKFSNERLIVCDPYVKVLGIDGKIIERPLSTFVAAQIVKTDGSWEYGFADSFSNKNIPNIVGLSRPIEFVLGEDCEADRLRKNGITTVIPYKGFRSWGGETTSSDPIWKSLTRIRIFDKIMASALDSLFWAIDRRADVLKSAKDSIEQMMLNLKGSNVLLGFNVYWDPDKNTKININEGKFYLVVDMQEMPIVKRFEINFSYVDRYSEILIKAIS